jgi:hypothetical protein
MGLSFTVAAGPCPRSHSRVRVPRDSLPYFTVSDSKLLQPGGPGSHIYIAQEQGGPVTPPGTGFPFRRLLRLSGLRWRYSIRPLHGALWLDSESEFESESYVTTAGQSANLSWNKAPIGACDQFCTTVKTVAGLLACGALSDKRAGLSFTVAAGPRQRSQSRVWVPWDSRPYFTVSNSRLPFSSPPTTHRATVEVFDPASTRECGSELPLI